MMGSSIIIKIENAFFESAPMNMILHQRTKRNRAHTFSNMKNKSMIRPILLSLILSRIFVADALECGCQDCTNELLDTYAGKYKCGDRINYMQSPAGGSLTEIEACKFIAGAEYPYTCGPGCDPDRCDQGGTPAPVTPYPTQSPKAPTDSLYCFPSEDGRVKYNDVWGSYRVEVKEGSICGPGGNRFSSDTVSVSDNGDELNLEFKKVNGNWEASEVRLLLPNHESDKFEYGEYKFHVKSVSITESGTGTITSTVLPKDLILGLFTWDPTEKYSDNDPQNHMHEVDIEISRWNGENNADIQFLMQPPGNPQMYRFTSGDSGSSSLDEKYDPSNHWYSFNWLPEGVYWSSTSGGGQTHEYTVEAAVLQGRRDYVQCLPANVELRFNLWNMFGSQAPDGVSDTEVVKVVIDNFEYVESPLRFIQQGDYCSKHCQCEGNCINGKCEIGTDITTQPTPSPSQGGVPCGCQECTSEVRETLAGQYTCGARIDWLQTSAGGSMTEAAACTKISNVDFGDVCGPMCDPTRCENNQNDELVPSPPPTNMVTQSPTVSPTVSSTDSPSGGPTRLPTKAPSSSPTISPSKRPTSSPTASPTQPPTVAKTPSPTISNPTYPCDCKECTSEVLDTLAGQYTCGARINWLQTLVGGSMTEAAACTRISNVEFEDVCGPMCDPTRCNEIPTASPIASPSTSYKCGCQQCTSEVWDTLAGRYTCGTRINWLQTSAGGSMTEAAACTRVSGDEFGGVCGPMCDPTRCDAQYRYLRASTADNLNRQRVQPSD